jgi:predicted phosphoribosyltransferase
VIIAPEALREQTPGTVVVMNPIYAEEVGRALRALGLDADVLVA